MRESLKLLKAGLIERWVNAHAEIKDIPIYQAKAVSYKYAIGSRYDVKDFNAGRIGAGGKMLNEKPSDGYDYYEYGFDEKGLPVTVRFSHTFNKIDWVGIYKIEKDIVEYIEFCMTTSVVSAIQRITFSKTKKLSTEYFALNGKTASLVDISQPVTKIIEFINTNRDHFIYDVLEFVHADNRIMKAYGVANSPGIGEFLYEDKYQYNENGKLVEIKTFYEDGHANIKYIAPSKRSLTEINNELAGMFCDHLIKVLQSQNIALPLFNVQLNYQYYSDYWPSLYVITEADKNNAVVEKREQLFADVVIDGSTILTFEGAPADLEKLYKEFYQRLETSDNWEAGRKMLCQTARLITSSKLKGIIPVTHDFVAFSIEWLMEAQDLEKILVQCGASKANIDEWKKYGWV
jgi:hypothetical protein